MFALSWRSALISIVLPIATLSSPLAADFDPVPLNSKVQEVENRLSARVGVSVIDTGSGKVWSYKGDQRFPTNSTFKAFLCAAFLDAGDAGRTDPDRAVTIRQKDLVTYSPVTEKRVGGKSFTVRELCEVTVTTSDNAAANLVMQDIGGPEALNGFLRRIGDEKTRADRWEPESNTGYPGDDRDTTTPDAAAETLKKLVLGTALTSQSRDQLTEWLIGNKVGNSTLRAGLPEGWKIADKTGAGGNGSRNNIAVIWPEDREPVVIAIYITQTEAPFKARNRAIAEIGAALAESVKP